MDEEDAFLRKLREQPANDLTRLVYADWLDERGTPEATAKAEFLRLIADAELTGRFAGRVKQLVRQLDAGWLAVVSKLPIENCHVSEDPHPDWPAMGVRIAFECPKRWEELTPTEDANERHCGECQRTVHYCHTAEELRTHATVRDCVAVALTVRRRRGDLVVELPDMVMGEFTTEEIRTLEDRDRGDEPRRSWWARLWRRRR